MTTWLPVVVIAALAVIIAAFFAFSARTGRRQREQADYIRKAAPLVQRRATVLAKDARRLETGTIKLPDHRIVYTVIFRTDEGETAELEVGEAAFGQLAEGMEDLLIIQNNRFVGFGDVGSIGRE